MRKTILLALMAVVATTAVTAQETEKRDDRRGPNPEKRVEKQVKRLDKKLKLSDSQKEQLKEFYGEVNKAQQARMEQMKAQRDAILTDEQKAKYAEMKEKDKEMWKEGHKGSGRGEGKGRGHGPGRKHLPGRGHGDHGGMDSFDGGTGQ